MGITKKTILICKCDLCRAECSEDDTKINIKLNGGFRDVGPDYLSATLRVDQSYGVSNGIVCRQCKLTWLRKYLEDEELAYKMAKDMLAERAKLIAEREQPEETGPAVDPIKVDFGSIFGDKK